MKKQKLDENKVKEILIVSDNEEEEYKTDLSPSEIYEKQNEAKKIEKEMKELEQKKEKIENELDKETKLKDIYEEFKKERDQFIFKIEYEDENFHESLAKNYLSAVLKGTAKGQGKDIKILKSKNIQNYLWFKVDKKMVIKWFIKKIEAKENFIGFKVTQLRVNNFFEDI